MNDISLVYLFLHKCLQFKHNITLSDINNTLNITEWLYMKWFLTGKLSKSKLQYDVLFHLSTPDINIIHYIDFIIKLRFTEIV